VELVVAAAAAAAAAAAVPIEWSAPFQVLVVPLM
jgi:hypothetical protein